jgi:hypothetical protein
MKQELAYSADTIRLWFEFLRLASQSDKPDVKAALKRTARSKRSYKDWGDVTKIPFKQWWRTHSHHFAETRVLRIIRADTPEDREEGFPPTSKHGLLLYLPLTRSATDLKKDIGAIIAEQTKKRPWKSKKQPSSSFKLSEGAEIKTAEGKAILENKLIVYRDVTLKNPKLKGSKLLDEVKAFYRARNEDVPDSLAGDKYTALRNLLRYNQDAERIMLNVAKGKFPGPRKAKQPIPRP